MPGKQMAIDADLNAGPDHRGGGAHAGARTSPARPTSTARWTAPRSSSRATRWRRCSSRAINLIGGIVIGVRAAGPPARGGRPALLAAERRRRPGRPDPGAAHLGGDRHHRHPLGLQGRPRHRRRRADHRASARRRSSRAPSSPPSRSSRACRRSRSSSSAASSSSPAARSPACWPSARRPRRSEAAAAALPAPATPRDQALEALSIDPLELSIGFGLVPLVDGGTGGSLLARVGAVRRQIAADLGTIIPPVRIHDDVGARLARVRR